jgi:hypothetical protein
MEADMAQQLADISSLREGAVVFFRSYGLSFSDGVNALLNDLDKPGLAGDNTGKIMHTIARKHGVTNDDALAFEKALEYTRDQKQAEPLKF